MAVAVHPYDPRWPELARVEAQAIRQVAGPAIIDIEHIGSTAIPGMDAKPIIDLMASTLGEYEWSALSAALPHLGYVLLNTGMPERLFFNRQGSPVAYHLHVVTEDTWDERNERLLRDHLLETSEDAVRYAALKCQLADLGLDSDDYTRAKTSLIQEMVDTARAKRGLPHVPVWES